MSDLGSDQEGHRMETSRDQQGLKKRVSQKLIWTENNNETHSDL